MHFNKLFVLSDNVFLIKNFMMILEEINFKGKVKYYCSRHSLDDIKNYYKEIDDINIKKEYQYVIKNYDLGFSLHCKQLWPVELVNSMKCINVHPGYNPFNRGWYPQVFSILNKKPIGATIHEMDEKLDNGAIIAQEIVKVDPSDTSLSLYEKIQNVEIKLLREYLLKILCNNYKVRIPEIEGNLNLKKDFINLCEIDLNKKVTFGDAIDLFRALSHPPYYNAYFKNNNEKIYVRVEIIKDINQNSKKH